MRNEERPSPRGFLSAFGAIHELSIVLLILLSCYTSLALRGLTTPSWTDSAPDRLRLFCVCLFVGWLCQYNTRKGNSTGRAPWRLLPPGN